MPSYRRPFEEVSLKATGAQFFKERYPGSRIGDDSIPVFSQWRCNTTGLSNVYNLYFVAYNDSIHVYQPKFYSQSISAQPALIIETEALQPSLRFWNRTERAANIGSRTIDRLLVQNLGKEEVIAVVRDDGDVEAYYTRQIQHAIERRMVQGNTLGVLASDVRPFFHNNVGNSAWGLAIHSNARMIAVSSNSFTVTVFSFALIDSQGDDDDRHPEESHSSWEDNFYLSIREARPVNDRKKNDVRILVNGSHNIPDIAFCNTDDDPTGRWLVTADIKGLVRTWDVHSMTLTQKTHTIMQPPRVNTGFWDSRNAVWGIMFLDHLSFRSAKTVAEALGVSAELPEKLENGTVWTLGETLDSRPGFRSNFRDVGEPVEVQDGNYAAPSNAPPPLPSAMGPYRIFDPRVHSHHSLTQHGPQDTTLELPSDADIDDEDFDSDESQGLDELAQYDPDHDHREFLKPNPSNAFGAITALCDDLPCPIMQLSVNDVYLYQPSPNNKSYEHLPILAFDRLFEQHLSTRIEPNTRSIDRINMHAQIPSLGVVIVASQIGRVAILSLTKTKTELPDYESMQNQQSGRRSSRSTRRRLYGFRVDHVLPLAGQEAAGHRPKCAIHGIAVGPMQGTEHLSEDQKRWRLMIMYQNHGLLSYEIGRPRGDDAAVELMGL